MSFAHRNDITGVILAGGRGHRIGGRDKGLVAVAGKPLIEHVLEALKPQVGPLLISANRNLDLYAAYGVPVVIDSPDGYQGPLAGMASALATAQTPYLLAVPCDAPTLPGDLARRLVSACAGGADAAVARVGHRIQPVFALLRCTLAGSLHAYLESGQRETRRWLVEQHAVPVDFSDQAACFANLNTAADLDAYQPPDAPRTGG